MESGSTLDSNNSKRACLIDVTRQDFISKKQKWIIEFMTRKGSDAHTQRCC